jgi:pimeloyl-ACP methyl ester carboxylesterase
VKTPLRPDGPVHLKSAFPNRKPKGCELRTVVSKTILGIHFNAAAWPLDPRLPTLVFIHGSGESSLLWRHQITAFDGLANAMALDLPGHGQSEDPARAAVEDYARDLQSFIHGVDAPWPIPCGLSIGGAITLQLLLEHADGLAAGILINTGARLRVMPDILKIVRSDYDAFIDLMSRLGFADTTDRDRVLPLLNDMRACPPSATAGDFAACDAFDVMGRLNEISAPILVVSADKDQLTPAKYADYLEAHIPNARRAHIPEAGHFSPFEQAGGRQCGHS